MFPSSSTESKLLKGPEFRGSEDEHHHDQNVPEGWVLNIPLQCLGLGGGWDCKGV